MLLKKAFLIRTESGLLGETISSKNSPQSIESIFCKINRKTNSNVSYTFLYKIFTTLLL
jgi:hypothetical protein